MADVAEVDRGYNPGADCVSATDHVDPAYAVASARDFSVSHVICSFDHVIDCGGHATFDAHVSAI